MIRRSRAAWGAVYHTSNTRPAFAAIRAVFGPGVRRSVSELLKSHDPDVVLSVHPLLNHISHQAIRKSGRQRALMSHQHVIDDGERDRGLRALPAGTRLALAAALLRAPKLLLLDEPTAAVTEAAEAIALAQTALPNQRHLYAELLVRTDQAQAHLQQPDLDGASVTLQPVLGLPADMRTEPILQQLNRLRRTLARPGTGQTCATIDKSRRRTQRCWTAGRRCSP